MKVFGVDIAALMQTTLNGNWPKGTLIKVAYGARTDGSLTAGQAQAETSYTYTGFLDVYQDSLVANTTVQVGDRRLFITVASLPAAIVPQTGDKVTHEATTYKIINVKRDGAAAIYVCQVRK